MVADALLVHPDKGLIVGCADVQKGAGIGFRLKIKIALVPDDPFEAEEGRLLRIPVARDFERRRSGEVVLFIVRADIDVGVGIERVAIVANLAIGSLKASCWWLINQVVPRAVQRHDGPLIETNEKRFYWLLSGCRLQEDSAGKENAREDPGETNHAVQPPLTSIEAIE